MYMYVVVQEGRTCSWVWSFPLIHPIRSVFALPEQHCRLNGTNWKRVQKQLLAAWELHTRGGISGMETTVRDKSVKYIGDAGP